MYGVFQGGKIFWLVFVSLGPMVAPQAYSQIVTEKHTAVISYAQREKEVPEKTIFSLMASNNEVNINTLKVNLSFVSELRLGNKSADYYSLQYRFMKRKATGDVRFRDFSVDSLFIPDSVEAEITLWIGNQTVGNYRQKLPFTAGTLLLEKRILFSSAPRPEIKIIRFIYSKEKVQRFIAAANLMNHYYGYALLYDKMLNAYRKRTLNSQEDGSEVFTTLLAWHRLLNYTAHHHFKTLLHLKQKDPKKLLKKRERVGRMLIRERTISRQLFGKQMPSGSCKHFVHAFVALSVDALSTAKTLQPYRAESFKEYASLFGDAASDSSLLSVTDYFDGRNDCKSSMQAIIDRFTEEAAAKIDKKAYVEGLILVENADYLFKTFHHVRRSALFINTYALLTDGLMDSYLQVALRARKAGNLSMFSAYYSKARTLFENHLKDSSYRLQRIIFPRFRNHLLDLAQETGSQWHTALKYATTALQANGDEKSQRIDSVFVKIYQTQLHEQFSTIHQMIVQKKLLKANTILDSAHLLLHRHADLLRFFQPGSIRFQEVAYALYLEILQQGEMDFDQGNTAKALTFLTTAAEMENNFFTFHSQDLKRLLKKSFTPAAMALLKKASLEVWANRTDNAKAIIRKVSGLQKEYHQMNDTALNGAIGEMQQRVIQRECLSQQNEFDNLANKVISEINTGHVQDASTDFQHLLVMQNSEGRCRLNRSHAVRIQQKYNDLFVFTARYKALKKNIFSVGLKQSLPQYTSLDQYYHQKNIDRFGVSYVTLYTFISKQGSPLLAKESLKYFLNQKNSKEAFRYLDLLRTMGTPATETGLWQRQLAKICRNQQIKPDKMVLNEGWYSSFRAAWSGKWMDKLF